MISVICVYNSEKILNNFLLKSLEYQDVSHELILVNAIEGQFNSAAEALNFGASKANGEFLMFVHQDVQLLSENWLKKSENYLRTINNIGIAGVAGISKKSHMYRKICFLCHRKKNLCSSHVLSRQPKEICSPCEVETLDELLLIIPKDVFTKTQFDENNTSWHLYGADYALTCQKIGLSAYVLPLWVYHLSNGSSMDSSYFSALSMLLNKYKEKKFILTTSGYWCRYYSILIPYLMVKGLSKELRKRIGINKGGFRTYLKGIRIILEGP